MAVPTTRQIRNMNRGMLRTRGTVLGNRVQNLGSDGSFSGSITDAAFGATDQTSITIADSASDGKFMLSVNDTGGTNSTVTLFAPETTQTVDLTLPDVSSDTLVGLDATQTLTAKTLTLPAIGDFTNAAHDHSNAAGGGALSAATGLVGTTENSFEIDSDNATGVLQLKTTTGGTDHTVILTNSTTTKNVTLSLPDVASDTLVALTATQTLTNKTLDAPTLTGTITISTTPAISGTWSDLGTVTTIDINGGTIDAAAIGGGTPAAGAFTTLAASGATTLSDDVTIAGDKDLYLASGTGFLQMNGNSDGALRISAIDTGTSTTTLTNSNCAGSRTVTLPDATCTLVGTTVSNTFTVAQTISINDSTNTGITDVLDLVHMTSGTAGTDIGIGITFGLEDASGNGDEAGRLVVQYTTATHASEDADMIFSVMVGGSVTAALTIDSSADELLVAGGLDTLTATAMTIAPAAATSLAVGATDITTTIKGLAKGEGEGAVVCGLVVDVTVSEINSGHTVITVPSGLQFQLIHCKAVAYGGAVGTVTTVDLLADTTKLVAYTQSNLTENTLLDMTDTGVTVLDAGASFTPETDGQDITVGKTGGSADTATGVRFIISYMLV